MPTTQKWLIQQAVDELKKFTDSNRIIPDIWILATNIDPSGKPATGAYDKIKKIVKEKLNDNVKFDIWGGRKILDFLAFAPEVTSHYGHFLTPGNVLTSLYQSINDEHAEVKTIINHLITSQFNEQNYTKLEQASSNGLTTDTKPKIHQLFVDLPFTSQNEDQLERILCSLVSSSAQVHKASVWKDDVSRYRQLSKHPKSARIFILKGGPGQGKSTVGQYFAQIQRAALILADDGPSVSITVRETAEQLKDVAVRDGFWLTSPRIPALVELKDFATWYGARQNHEPTGVLSYLSEKISQKSEQKVLPATLRRAFSIRSWFFNFDGLDEVPNDVKDKISDEIIKFSEEILPSIDCDALILCSTRPQGYSGQFDILESAVTVLVNLPKSVALECAKAVVRFGRSESDGDQSEETLHSAMDSPQVRELMTTPLQSHIMAVVVRDGGRPPEKRWELFDNFYKVMKKRESQKNFQDARVAQLLREGDTLLKAIHARLGVSLHARAEISEGAETKLEKSEFEQLAIQTVKMLMDEAVDDTVEALMEATTERLVFVNTPESHKAVRFDIRQLQEFFAGEFIYSDVSPDIIRSRIESISADAHWREVMHFFLSALVANNRITDIVNAAEVLIATDTDEACHKTRIYRRRMATGALLALRLLSEGVLEQDKRIRQHFANVIPPLFGSLEERTISQLIEITNLNTKSWLINQMIEQLFDASEEEQIGAAIALTRYLPDTHAQIDRVCDKLSKSSDSYLKTIYGFQLPARLYRKKLQNFYITPKWFVELSLKILLSHAPRKSFDYFVIFNFLRANKYILFSTSTFQNLPVLETKLLFSLFDIESDLGLSEYVSTSPVVGLMFKTSINTWKSGTIPQTLNYPIPEKYPLGPFLDYCASAIRAAQSRAPDEIIKFCSKSRELKSSALIIPTYIQALIPLDFWGDSPYDFDIRYHAAASKKLERILKTGKLDGRNINPATESIQIKGKFTSASWKKLCREYQTLAVGLSFDTFEMIGLETPENSFAPPVVELAFQQPELFAPYILKWGELFRLAGSRATELRAHFITSYERQFTSYDCDDYYISSIVSGFTINLNNEAIWLPQIASRLAFMMSTSEHPFRESFGSTALKGNPVYEFGFTSEVLTKVFESSSNSFSIRQGALACYYLLDFGQDTHNFFSASHQEVVSELFNRDAPLWLVSAIFRFIERNLSHTDKGTIVFVGYCLDLYRDNYEARAIMQPLLSKWRERSSAPLSTSISVETWLAQQK